VKEQNDKDNDDRGEGKKRKGDDGCQTQPHSGLVSATGASEEHQGKKKEAIVKDAHPENSTSRTNSAKRKLNRHTTGARRNRRVRRKHGFVKVRLI